MKVKTIFVLFIILGTGLITACKKPLLGENNPLLQTKTLTPTLTPTTLSLRPDVITETPEKPLPTGNFEVHAITVVQEEQECIVNYPFKARVEDGRLLLESDPNIEVNCNFVGTFYGDTGSLDIHLSYLLDTKIEAEVLGYFSSTSPSIHAFYYYDGEMRVFYSGFPPEAINPWPENDPMTIPLMDMANLVFPFEDGAQGTAPIGIGIDQQMDIPQPVWEFILKLD